MPTVGDPGRLARCLPLEKTSARDLPAALGDRDADWVYVRFVPTAGQVVLAHRAGKRVFLVAIGLFTIASTLCGAAQSPAWLIIARGAQGIGGSLAGMDLGQKSTSLDKSLG